MSSWVEKGDLAGAIAKVTVFIWLKQKGRAVEGRSHKMQYWNGPSTQAYVKLLLPFWKGAERGRRKSSLACLPRLLLMDVVHLGQGGEPGGIPKADCRPGIVGEFVHRRWRKVGAYSKWMCWTNDEEVKIEANGNRVHNAENACRWTLKLFNPLRCVVLHLL